MSKRSLQKYIFIAILFLGLPILGFVLREPLRTQWESSSEYFLPCTTPITYSVGTFDTRFGISKEDFLRAVKDAEAIWEKPINKELFSYVSDGDVLINLVYDYRQDTTQVLQKLGLTVDQNKTSYTELENSYELKLSRFELDTEVFESQVAAFEARKKIYENDARSATRRNRQKNISKEEYARLNAEGDFLEHEAATLNAMQADLQKEVEGVNMLARALNDLAKTLNLSVTRYNEIGGSFNGEFTQGSYENHGEGGDISIFQYDSYEKLVRVLAHELGHALSLAHLDDPEAIMYRLNQGDNSTVTSNDLFALKTRCGIK
ncbi:MAG: matrixin family metalloprotease [Candidatus Azambacteria bacterium]|nr:matrixin family metalloprotease [Candidatus Azambacteria bacterium]